MQLGQIFQGVLSFYLLLSSVTCLCAGRFGLAPLTSAAEVRLWVERNPTSYWVEGEDRVLFFIPGSKASVIPGGPRTVILEARLDASFLYFYYGSGPLPKDSRELLRGGRVRVIESSVPLDPASREPGTIRPFIPNHRLVRSLGYSPSLEALHHFSSLTAALDAETWHSELDELSKFSRYTYGPGIAEARTWLVSRFRSIAGLKVEEIEFSTPRGRATNIVATLPGRSRPDEVYIIGAHYDSTSEKPYELAPGAEDNGSGTAGLLALARVFAEQPTEATLVFVAFAGEEQGLLGSRALVSAALADGSSRNIHGVMIMDMIGYSGDQELDCLLESSAASRPLLDRIQSAQSDRELVLAESLDYWGSDHVPFLDNNIPAVLFIENDYIDYPAYHRSLDTVDKVHATLGPKILSLIADTLGSLAY